MQEELKKQIRTTNGPKSKESFNYEFVLPYEHVSQNLCDYILKLDNQALPFKQDDDISLKNVSDISQNIYSSLKNLYLESDSTKCADELSLLKEYKCGLVVDATTKKNGQNLNGLREISKICGIDIAFGYTLKEDFYSLNLLNKDFNFEKVLGEIRYEIAYGFDDFIPSFLGEIIISEPENFPNQNEDKLFTILFKVIEEFRIPIFIKLNYASCSDANVFEYFDKKCAQSKIDKKLVVFIHSKMNDSTTDKDEINFIVEEILEKGFTLILCLYDCDLVLLNKIKENKTITNVEVEEFSKNTPYFYKDKLNFIITLILTNNKKYLGQIMISNNINFKIHLKKYGGFGYPNLFKNYLNKISKVLEKDEIKKIFYDNLLDLLSWWEPPKKTEKKIKYITCSK